MDKKIQADFKDKFQIGAILLRPLEVRSYLLSPTFSNERAIDLHLELAFPGQTQTFRFLVEVKSRSTPKYIQDAITQARAAVRDTGEHPMIAVPYLSPERLADLEEQQVSGVDLCGNGVIIVPERLYVLRTGFPNKYPETRPLNNPYRGRSAMVARMLLERPRWDSLNELVEAIASKGVSLSTSQTSKAIQSLQDDLIVTKAAGKITLHEPRRLLDKLASEWRKPPIRKRKALRVSPNVDWPQTLSSSNLLQWAITGESSVKRYAMFTQGGPHKVAVTSLPLALSLVEGTPEPIANFADVELLETEEPGFYFGNEVDQNQMRWASRIQTWLELQAGDPRQQDAARKIREQILIEVAV